MYSPIVYQHLVNTRVDDILRFRRGQPAGHTSAVNRAPAHRRFRLTRPWAAPSVAR
jgi:hypothetical protein